MSNLENCMGKFLTKNTLELETFFSEFVKFWDIRREYNIKNFSASTSSSLAIF